MSRAAAPRVARRACSFTLCTASDRPNVSAWPLPRLSAINRATACLHWSAVRAALQSARTQNPTGAYSLVQGQHCAWENRCARVRLTVCAAEARMALYASSKDVLCVWGWSAQTVDVVNGSSRLVA